ncbi:MAG: exodeoxyribonuclease VII large subunit [Verrucomicrobiae bacterium]|nr:exodeoxyribonuclease VII large subunit [Verrucomicrobiae bacterium]
MNPKIYTVTEVTRRVRMTLEEAFGQVWVEGEISNLHYHSSGHVYLTLKDAQAQLTAVMFRSSAARLPFRLKDGMQAQASGRLTVYEKRGNYQLVIETIQPAGRGALQAAFEALKRKLEAEGLFDAARKRPLPVFPRTVAVVTSPTGAAIRDFCRVLHRRFPGVRVIVAPVRVQGEGAGEEIAAAVDLLNSPAAAALKVDAIALIRGGGSLEDLWAFNEEAVARAVARSALPTISGVGHEVDFTICDFAADVRAPTPSAAAELLIRPRDEMMGDVLTGSSALDRVVRLAILERRQFLSQKDRVLRRYEPRQWMRQWRLRLDEMTTDMETRMREVLRASRDRWQAGLGRLREADPRRMMLRKRQRLQQWDDRRRHAGRLALDRLGHRLKMAGQRLELLSPKATLERGYSITREIGSGGVIRSAAMVSAGKRIRTLFKDGEVNSVVE